MSHLVPAFIEHKTSATTSKRGLTDAQVTANRERYGANVLTPPKRASLLSQFIEKFDDPLIKILLVALLMSAGLAVYEYVWLGMSTEVLIEPVGIFVAIVLATLVGFLVEVNANRKFELLNKTNDDVMVKVKRNGMVTQVKRRDVVEGDVVMLDTGERVPADGRLIDSMNLSVNESSLTGEPVARKSHKLTDAAAADDTTYSTREVLRGSTVTEGHGVMVVTRVGDRTEYGKVFTEAQIDNHVQTPLMQQFDRLGKLITTGSYIIAALIVAGRLLMLWLDGRPDTTVETLQYLVETVMLAVTLIVVSVPEGLPMSVTLSLALSMRRMLQSNNLVRKMHACETMGATTVICTDKTGTLTQNQMRVYQAHFYGLNEGCELTGDTMSAVVKESIASNSTAFLDLSDPEHAKALGNPTEGALLLWLHDAGIDYLPLRDDCVVEAQLPFSTERKMMVTVVRSGLTGKRLMLLKGAPEIVLRFCNTIAGGVSFQQVTDELLSYQSKAMRTLGFAYRELEADEPATHDGTIVIDPSSLIFLGIVAISDPVRPDVPAAIADVKRAGVEVKIVTGDTPGTAREVGRQVGLWQDDTPDDAIISGPEFAALSDEEALKRVKALKIMSRARPDDKARLVRMLQRGGEVVAVTGDGTNDAPALNAAQVGLSMGDGTAVAKEASDITILDNSFASIGKAVLWGRSLYRNIQRFILFQLTVNVCACLVVAICSFFSKQPVLTVTQMLWVNLIMDTFAALALASLPPNSVVMRDKPRRAADNIITRKMASFILGCGIPFSVLMIALFGWTYFFSGVPHQVDTREMTYFFTAFVFFQFWNLFNARSFGTAHSAFHNVSGSRVFFMVVSLIFVGQILIVQFLGPVFNCVPLSVTEWGWLVLGTMPVMLAGEIYHMLQMHRARLSSQS